MRKTSTPWKPVDQSKTTAPVTRNIDPARAGQAGSVAPSKQPVGTPATRGVAYAQRIPLSDSAKQGGKDVPMPDGNATSVQRPSDVKVSTVSDYPDPPRDVIADDK
jgi:hypothetical protein